VIQPPEDHLMWLLRVVVGYTLYIGLLIIVIVLAAVIRDLY
jgi:hypothetical protein